MQGSNGGPATHNLFDQGGEMTEKFKLVLEYDVEARCMLHGKNYISMSPRIGNLGHGRAFIEQGQAHCRGPGCNGTSQWITLETVVTKWNTVSEEQFQVAMKHALEAEMGALVSAEPEPEEEEVPVVEHRPEQSVPTQPGGTGGFGLLRRPPLGVGGIQAVVQPTTDGGRQPEE